MFTIMYIKLSDKIFSPLSSLKVTKQNLKFLGEKIKGIGYFLNNENEKT